VELLLGSPQRDFQHQTLTGGGVFSGGLAGRGLWPRVGTVWKNKRCRLWDLRRVFARPPLDTRCRIGCFAADAATGKETHHWWGVVFTNPLANFNYGTPLGVPLDRHSCSSRQWSWRISSSHVLLKRRKFDGQVIGAFMFNLRRRQILPGVSGANDPGPRLVFGAPMTGTQLIAIGW